MDCSTQINFFPAFYLPQETLGQCLQWLTISEQSKCRLVSKYWKKDMAVHFKRTSNLVFVPEEQPYLEDILAQLSAWSPSVQILDFSLLNSITENQIIQAITYFDASLDRLTLPQNLPKLFTLPLLSPYAYDHNYGYEEEAVEDPALAFEVELPLKKKSCFSHSEVLANEQTGYLSSGQFVLEDGDVYFDEGGDDEIEFVEFSGKDHARIWNHHLLDMPFANVQNCLSGNLLHLAIKAGSKEYVTKLLSQNPKYLHSVNIMGQTPLQLAIEYQSHSLLSTLLSHGATWNFADLEMVMTCEDWKSVSILLNEGNSVSAVTYFQFFAILRWWVERRSNHLQVLIDFGRKNEILEERDLPQLYAYYCR